MKPAASHDVSAPLPPSADPCALGDLARWRSTGLALAVGGDMDGGDAGPAASEDSNPARAL